MENIPSGHTVMIIDDEHQIRRLLSITLEANGFHVLEAATGKEGLIQTGMRHPDIVLLDLGLPDIDGLQVLQMIREWSTMPVIILTVMNDEETIVQALDKGADDYITKPFNTGELLARLRVALRHSLKTGESPLFSTGSLQVDLISRNVTLKGQAVRLTATEYSLLVLFIRHAGKVLTHSFISKEVWGNPYADNSQILRVHIAQLRKKTELNPSIPEYLITEPGVGYRLRVLPEL